MKITCLINNFLDLANDEDIARIKEYIRIQSGEMNIDIGNTYTVYGITIRDGHDWYYICQDSDDEYPVPYPSICFKITESSPSEFWKKSIDGDLLIDEWAEDPAFYERLLDEQTHEVRYFEKMKILMNNE